MPPRSEFGHRGLSTSIATLIFVSLLSIAVPVSASGPRRSIDDQDIVLPDLSSDETATVSAEEDPLGLVPFAAYVSRHTIGTDVIEVWVCGISVHPAEIVERLEKELTPYFETLSRGYYSTDFVVGGTVGSTDRDQCLSEASARSPGTSNAALVVGPGSGGMAGPGDNGPTFPGNQRWAMVGYDGAFISVVAHEIGHTIHFPHSFTGKTQGSGREYDNARDVMSGNYGSWEEGGVVYWGTYPMPYEAATINRYAAGWIDQLEVKMIGSEAARFTLSPPSEDVGYQMAVIPISEETYYTLGASTRSAHDPIPGDWEGVDVYEVHECPHDTIAECYAETEYFGFRRHIPTGESFVWRDNAAYSKPLDLTIPVGNRVQVGDRVVSVEAGGGASYRVVVSGGFFSDVGDSVFRHDIAWLLGAGITQGCNPPANTLYCPDQSVTRGQMAAFLKRALYDSASGGASVEFDDDDDSVFENDIEWLAEREITLGCNPPRNTRFCPEDDVTRGEMAAFMRRTLPHLEPTRDSQKFSDGAGSVFAEDIAWLAARGITLGCNPPENNRFCPDDVVTRGEMAAFLRRALTH